MDLEYFGQVSSAHFLPKVCAGGARNETGEDITDETFRAISVGSGFLSLVCSVVVIVGFIASKKLRTHPSGLLLGRAVIDLFFSLNLITTRLTGVLNNTNSDCPDDFCKHVSPFSEFLSVGGEMYVLVLVVDLLRGVADPFLDVKVAERQYHAVVLLVSAAFAVLPMPFTFKNGESVYGPSPTLGLCAIREVNSRMYDFWFWICINIHIIMVYAMLVYVLLFVSRRLQAGLRSTFSTGIWYVWALVRVVAVYFVFTSIAAVLVLVSLLRRHESKSWHGAVTVVLGLRGVPTMIAWILMTNAWHVVCRRGSGMAKDRSTGPRLNAALRREVLQLATVGLRKAAVLAKGDRERPDQTTFRRSGGGRERTRCCGVLEVPSFSRADSLDVIGARRVSNSNLNQPLMSGDEAERQHERITMFSLASPGGNGSGSSLVPPAALYKEDSNVVTMLPDDKDYNRDIERLRTPQAEPSSAMVSPPARASSLFDLRSDSKASTSHRSSKRGSAVGLDLPPKGMQQRQAISKKERRESRTWRSGILSLLMKSRDEVDDIFSRRSHSNPHIETETIQDDEDEDEEDDDDDDVSSVHASSERNLDTRRSLLSDDHRRATTGAALPAREGGEDNDDVTTLPMVRRFEFAVQDGCMAQCTNPMPRPGGYCPRARLFFSLGREQPAPQFMDFAPQLFYEIRRISGVDEDDYAASLSRDKRESFTEGASGAFLYFSRCGKYILKTVSAPDAAELYRFLPHYLEHVRNNPFTLLTRVYGLHAITVYGHTLYLVVMGNVLHGLDGQVDERYDLKGSWVNRNADKIDPGARGRLIAAQLPGDRERAQQRRRGERTLRDNDLMYSLRLPRSESESLEDQLRRDTEFLRDRGVMDYSLLLGVKRIRFNVSRSLRDQNEDDEEEQVVGTSRDAQGRRVSFLAEGNPVLHETKAGGGRVLQAAVVEGPGAFSMGIIDITQSWSLRKRAERFLKITLLQRDPEGISAINPTAYQTRFMERVVSALLKDHIDQERESSEEVMATANKE